MAYAQEEGCRELPCGKEVEYQLLYPRAPSPIGTVVLVHGFSRDRTAHLQTAHDVASQGLVAFAADMVTLLWGSSSQIRNIDGVMDHVRWLIRRGQTPGDALFRLVDPLRIVLVGHSAGGAVCLEAAWRLQAANVPPAGLVLLDAVPWPRTLEEVPPRLQPLPLCSVRCEPSAWNLKNIVLRLQQRLAFPSTDLFVVGASHVDPERPLEPPGRLEERAKSWLGLQGQEGTQDVVGQLMLSFIYSLLLPHRHLAPSYVDLQLAFSARGLVRVASIGPRQR
eukprot:EG_transcript_21519